MTTPNIRFVTKNDLKAVSVAASEKYANQNAFSKVQVDNTAIEADSASDTLNIVAGSNVTLTPNAGTNTLIIAATDTDAHNIANAAMSGVNRTLIYDHTYTLSGGVATFTAHVWCKGVEVTSDYPDSAFAWSYRQDSAISGTPTVTSLGTGKTKQVKLSQLGMGGHVIGTFTTD